METKKFSPRKIMKQINPSNTKIRRVLNAGVGQIDRQGKRFLNRRKNMGI